MQKRYGLSLILLVFLLSSCDKGSNPVGSGTEQNIKWQEDESYFRSGKIILNARVSSDSSSFMVAGIDAIALYQTGKADSITHAIAQNDELLSGKPAISDQYIAYKGTGSSQFIINSPLYWVGSRTSASFPFTKNFHLGDTPYYTSKASIPVEYKQTPMGAFNSQGQFFTVISDTSEAYQTNISLCLIDLNPTHNEQLNGNPLLEFSPKVHYTTYNTDVTSGVSYIGAFNNNFYASINDDLMRVAPGGSVQKTSGINIYIDDMFSHDDTLFAYSSGRNKLFRSLDDGQNWQPYLANFPDMRPHFFYINDTLCFYVYSQIAKVDVANGKIMELDNTGLEGNEITSVNKFNGRVWITTLSGMYYKPSDAFFTVKENSDQQGKIQPSAFKVIQ